VRAVTWVKPEPLGAEFADVLIERGRLTASGIAIGSTPVGYRLDYKLETGFDFVTSGLLVIARGDGWRRRLDLRRLRSGRWTVRTSARGDVDLPPPGSDMSEFGDALDCDLALSPLTNSCHHGFYRHQEWGLGPVLLFPLEPSGNFWGRDQLVRGLERRPLVHGARGPTTTCGSIQTSGSPAAATCATASMEMERRAVPGGP
jgi:hypothetical protein